MGRRIAALMLVVVGLGLLGYPTLRVAYLDYQQRKIMTQWQNDMRKLEQAGLNDDGGQEEQADSAAEQAALLKRAEAILEIKKIGLQVPILTGTSARNLNVAVASIENTGKAGEVGNYGIAGHRSRTYGRQFNRLDELVCGDEIKVVTEEKVYIYEVQEKLLVQPEESWVLKGNGEERLITLVTCDYSEKPYLRLVIRGKMAEPQEQ